jgi:FKBP-type peptidyl-prolyl cis-trans isomerase
MESFMTRIAAPQVALMAGIVMATPAFGATTFKNDQEKVSYMIGYQIGSNFKRDGLEVDLNILTSGLKAALAGEKSPLTAEESQKLMTELQKNLQAKAEAKQKAEGEKNLKAGKDFLTVNSKKDGVKTTASGLQYKVLAEGKGDVPKATDTVKVNYRGTLIDGTEFDSSYKRGQPAQFPVGGVIKGWTEALQLMKPGSKMQIWIPSDLAYGPRGAGDLIGPNATLAFEVELLGVEKPQPAAAQPAAAQPAAAQPAAKK